MHIRMATSAAIGALTIAMTATSALAETPKPHPMFAVIPHAEKDGRVSALPTFKYSFTYNGKSYSDSFVGTDPSAGAVSTTVPVFIIPVQMTTSDGTVTDPTKKVKGVKPKGSVITSVVSSPLFNSGVDFKSGGTDIGSTQYVDAFEKMALWNDGGSATGYHVLLGTPTIEPTLKLKVPKADGTVGTPIDGIKVQEVSINYFDQQINADITKLKIPSGAFPIFVTTQAYLTSGGCCIGGYHSYVGSSGVAYAHATYIVNSGKTVTFSQDVGALSHEISEWQDDPFTANNSPCGIYEVGDPLEGDANYGMYTYALGGFTYHLQDEAAPPYFGSPASVTLGGQDTFQGTKLSVCQNGS